MLGIEDRTDIKYTKILCKSETKPQNYKLTKENIRRILKLISNTR